MKTLQEMLAQAIAELGGPADGNWDALADDDFVDLPIRAGLLKEMRKTIAAPEDDAVNHPAHYNKHPSGVECIDVVEHMGFNLGNTVKYVWRAGLKGGAAKELEDLQKAAFYLTREIRRLGGTEPDHQAVGHDSTSIQFPPFNPHEILRHLVEEHEDELERHSAEDKTREDTFFCIERPKSDDDPERFWLISTLSRNKYSAFEKARDLYGKMDDWPQLYEKGYRCKRVTLHAVEG